MQSRSTAPFTKHDKPDWKTARILWPYLWRYRGRIVLGVTFLILARLANIAVPIVLKNIIDGLGGLDASASTQALIVVPTSLIVAYALLRFSSILFNELRNLVFVRASVNTIRAIAVEVFEHLHRLSLRFHLDRKTGGLSRDIERGTRAISGFMRFLVFNILPTFFEISVVIGYLFFNFNYRFGLVTLVTIVLYGIFTFFVTQWRTRFRLEMNEAESNSNTQAIDSLLNYETVKVFGSEKREAKNYATVMEQWGESSMQSNTSLAFLNLGQALIIAVGMLILLWMAAAGVRDQELTLGEFVMINAFLIQLYIPLNFLGSIYRELTHSLIDMKRMFNLLEENPDVVESKQAKPLALTNGTIELRDVSFAYQANKPVLQNLNLTIAGGSTVAIVGPSGSGKSTFSRLLLRFYDPTEGEILIDDQAVKSLTLNSLRAAIGIVPQDTVLFNNTIGYNIRYGNPEADEATLIKAAERAQIHDFISNHPEGYDILVGERGLKLSGGEKQRVAIARTILKEAGILIFDEATSSLDTRSERAIQSAIDEISKDCTTLIIAHRLSTIVNADQIIVLDQGRVREQGTHKTLLSNDDLYKQMWAMQEKEVEA